MPTWKKDRGTQPKKNPTTIFHELVAISLRSHSSTTLLSLKDYFSFVKKFPRECMCKDSTCSALPNKFFLICPSTSSSATTSSPGTTTLQCGKKCLQRPPNLQNSFVQDEKLLRTNRVLHPRTKPAEKITYRRRCRPKAPHAPNPPPKILRDTTATCQSFHLSAGDSRHTTVPPIYQKLLSERENFRRRKGFSSEYKLPLLKSFCSLPCHGTYC